jgi:hypothetical protein
LASIRSKKADRGTGEFKKAYPEAKLYAVKEVADKKKKEGIEFAGGTYFLRPVLPRRLTLVRLV